MHSNQIDFGDLTRLQPSRENLCCDCSGSALQLSCFAAFLQLAANLSAVDDRPYVSNLFRGHATAAITAESMTVIISQEP